MRVDFIALFVMTILTFVVVVGRNDDGSNAVILCMLMTSILTIQFNILVLLKLIMYIENLMVNVERCVNLLYIPQEKSFSDMQEHPAESLQKPSLSEF